MICAIIRACDPSSSSSHAMFPHTGLISQSEAQFGRVLSCGFFTESAPQIALLGPQSMGQFDPSSPVEKKPSPQTTPFSMKS